MNDIENNLIEFKQRWKKLFDINLDEFERETKNKSRFVPIPKWEYDNCKGRGHYPPSYLYIPPGQIYIHVCNECGKETKVMSMQVTI